MPKLNGYDTCRLVRQQSWAHSAMIFALTGWGQDDDKRLSEEAGFDGHLVKPVGALADIGLLEELIRIVNKAQEHDAEDERRLYGPPIPEGLSFQRRRE